MSCPTLPFFSVRDRTIGVGLCDNLANEQIKVSFLLTQLQSIIANFACKVKQNILFGI